MPYNDSMFLPPWNAWSNDFINTENWDEYNDVCTNHQLSVKNKYSYNQIRLYSNLSLNTPVAMNAYQ